MATTSLSHRTERIRQRVCLKYRSTYRQARSTENYFRYNACEQLKTCLHTRMNEEATRRQVFALETFDRVSRGHGSAEDIISVYDNWGEDYETDIKNLIADNQDEQLKAAFLELNLKKDAKIIEIVGGTGRGASRLREAGYTNIDGHDGSQRLLEIARQKGCYDKCICAMIGGDYKLPIDGDVYDAAVMCGAFSPGHLKSDCFPEIIRIVKKGGYLVWITREIFLKHEYQKDFNKNFQTLYDKQMIEEVRPPKDMGVLAVGNTSRTKFNGLSFIVKVL